LTRFLKPANAEVFTDRQLYCSISSKAWQTSGSV